MAVGGRRLLASVVLAALVVMLAPRLFPAQPRPGPGPGPGPGLAAAGGPALGRWNVSEAYVALLRVPKVGSKSLAAVLRRVAPVAPGFCVSHGPASCRRYASCSRLRLPAVRVLPRAVVLQPHAAWDELRLLLDARPARYLTFLRHPVARVVSEYKHVASTPGTKCAWDYRAYARLPLTTDNCLAYVRDRRNLWGARNRQTRMLAGINITNTSQLLEVALQHLRGMDFVGLTERYEALYL